MTALEKTSDDYRKDGATHVHDSRNRNPALKVGGFLLHFLEMLLAMGVGMGIYHFLASLIPASSRLAVLNERGTVLHALGMNFFMIAAMLAWMIVRGHGWRHSAEMGIAMLAPEAVVALLCQFGTDKYLPWLKDASGPAMFLGMLAAMLIRRDHFTIWSIRPAHRGHLSGRPIAVKPI